MTQLLNYEFDLDRVVEHLDTKGMFLLRNLVSKELVEALKLEGKNLYRKSPKFALNTRAGDLTGSYRINIVPIRVQKYDGYHHISSIKSVIDHPRIRSLANTVLRSKSGVSNYIYDYSTANSDKDDPNKELFPLHYDWRNYGRFNETRDEQLEPRQRHCRCVKFYIFLSDIQLEQGAIRYIPYSHHFVRYLWSNNTAALQKIRDREASWNQLKHLLTAVTKEIEEDYPNKELLKNLRRVAFDLDQSYDFAISGKGGDVLVFDENGIHGGGRVRFGHRSICRIHYVDRDYVNDRLPDQQSGAIRHLVSPLRRRIQSLLNLVL